MSRGIFRTLRFSYAPRRGLRPGKPGPALPWPRVFRRVSGIAAAPSPGRPPRPPGRDHGPIPRPSRARGRRRRDQPARKASRRRPSASTAPPWRGLAAHGTAGRPPEGGRGSSERASPRQGPAGDALELAFALAGEYLGLNDAEAAAALFARIARERPIPQTHVLIGRAYRDFGELRPRPRRAAGGPAEGPARAPRALLPRHGRAAGRGRRGLDEAIEEFEAELKIAPDDPLASLELGVALVERQRPRRRCPPSRPRRAPARPSRARSPTSGAPSSGSIGRPRPRPRSPRALELATRAGREPRPRCWPSTSSSARRWRGSAATEEAAAHFAESQRLSAAGHGRRAGAARPLPRRPRRARRRPTARRRRCRRAERLALQRRVTSALARTYLNLGVLQAQAERFARAAELFEKAAAVDPDFPQVQSSLGVAYFNARLFDKATGPLARALAAGAGDAGLKRMLALAWLNRRRFRKAAELLRDDPEREPIPSLQFAYGLALVKSDRAAEAEPIFARLLAVHGDSAELSVLLGQAHAQQGDFDVGGAGAAAGPAAEARRGGGQRHAGRHLPPAGPAAGGRAGAARGAGRAPRRPALAAQPGHRPRVAAAAGGGAGPAARRAEGEAGHRRRALPAGQDPAGAGAAAEAVEHLEAAARLAPEDASIRYQLGQAYQKLGRTELAQQQFEVFRQLKEKRGSGDR